MKYLKKLWLRTRDRLLKLIYPKKRWRFSYTITKRGSSIRVDDLFDGSSTFVQSPEIKWIHLGNERTGAAHGHMNPIEEACCAPMDQGGFNGPNGHSAMGRRCGKMWLQPVPDDKSNEWFDKMVEDMMEPWMVCRKCKAPRPPEKHSVGIPGPYYPACEMCGDPAYVDKPESMTEIRDDDPPGKPRKRE